ncbi:MAG: Zeta toxin, partial [Gammaproteobacteria bacterium]|nr:Zeta toxin [Gammaproteobacteria bacterium]
FAARETVNKLKQDYGAGVRVDVLMKNIDNTHRSYKANVDLIDNYVPEKYTRESLSRALTQESN